MVRIFSKQKQQGPALLILLGMAASTFTGCVDFELTRAGKLAYTGQSRGIKVVGNEKLTAAHVTLGKYCYQCHATYKQIGIDAALTEYLVVPGKPFESKLFAAIVGSGGTRDVTPYAQLMPLGPAVDISDEEIDSIGDWILSLDPSAAPKAPADKVLPPPRFARISPASPSDSSTTPVVSGSLDLNAVPGSSASDVAAISIFRDGSCSQLVRTGTVAAFADPGLSLSVPANATTPIYAQASDAVGAKSACVLLTNYTHRMAAPADPAAEAAARLTKAMAVIQGSSCVACHGPNGPYAHLNFATDSAWLSARAGNGLNYVVRGKPENSFLFLKLIGNGVSNATGEGISANMPYGSSTGVSASELAAVKDWINRL